MKREQGFTLIELLIVVAIIGVLASIGVMSMLRARASANESAVIGSMRVITSGQIAYSSACGRGGFAANLPAMSGYISEDLTSAVVVQKSGYRIVVGASQAAVASPVDCNGTVTLTGYYATGEPLNYGSTGGRSFATASPNTTIWQTFAAVAPAEPFAAPAAPIQ